MVAETFPHALRLVLVDEGGCDDDPHDHGGRTAHGIIQREFDGYCERHGKARRDVWSITPAEYTEIYHDRYWMPWCDRLPAGFDYAFFDACVNAGPAQAARTLQKVLGLRIDGHMGDVTLAKANRLITKQLIQDFCDARRAFYRSLAQFPRYGRGWLARVDHVERAALEMAAGGAPTRNGLDDETKKQATARADAQKPTPPVVQPSTAGGAAVGGGLLASLVDELHQIMAQLTPFQDSITAIKYALVGVTLICSLIAIYGILHKLRTQAAV